MTDHDAKVREAVDTGKAGGVRDKLFAFAMELGASHPRYITLLNACLILESIAAARAEATATERARCVAAVEKERPKQPWGAGLDRGPSLFVLDVCNRLDHIIAALRGTEEAPDDPH